MGLGDAGPVSASMIASAMLSSDNSCIAASELGMMAPSRDILMGPEGAVAGSDKKEADGECERSTEGVSDRNGLGSGRDGSAVPTLCAKLFLALTQGVTPVTEDEAVCLAGLAGVVEFAVVEKRPHLAAQMLAPCVELLSSVVLCMPKDPSSTC